jgi:hypothetical protein
MGPGTRIIIEHALEVATAAGAEDRRGVEVALDAQPAGLEPGALVVGGAEVLEAPVEQGLLLEEPVGLLGREGLVDAPEVGRG